MLRAFSLIFIVPILAASVFSSEPSMANELCPVLTDEKADLNIYTEYQGKCIYFCCARYWKQFLETPGEYLAISDESAESSTATGTGHAAYQSE